MRRFVETAILVLVMLSAACGNLPERAWYAFKYGVPQDKVTIDDAPTDCDWFYSPLGSKGCHYEKEVSTIRWATSTANEPIVSYDEGKTWNVFAPDATDRVPSTPTVVSVWVGWKKVGGAEASAWWWDLAVIAFIIFMAGSVESAIARTLENSVTNKLAKRLESIEDKLESIEDELRRH